MKKIEFFLNKLDKIFESLQTKEKIVIYLSVTLIIGAILYLQILPMNKKKITILENKITKLQNAVKNNERAIKDNEEQKILLKEVERSNESIKEEINNNKKALVYINKKIKQQHNIKYSSEQWGIFFKEIQLKANKHKIKIEKIENEELSINIPQNIGPKEKTIYINKMKKEFRPIFKVTIVAIASFRDLMDFLVDIEKNKLITKLNVLNILNNDEKTLRTTIEINLWGIK